MATNAGLISCDMQCKSNVVTAGSVTAVICTDKKGTVVKGTEKKLNLGKKNDEYVTSFYAKKGKTYYLKLRAYRKESNGKKTYSKFSKVVKCKL